MITNSYSCPNCEADITVDFGDKVCVCPECLRTFEICPDAEFLDGMWRDRSTLKEKQPVPIPSELERGYPA